MRREFIVKPIDGNFSLKEHIYDVLKDAIMAMNIYADDAKLKLDERQLSEQLQISRTPIREAPGPPRAGRIGARRAKEGCVHPSEIGRRDFGDDHGLGCAGEHGGTSCC